MSRGPRGGFGTGLSTPAPDFETGGNFAPAPDFFQ